MLDGCLCSRHPWNIPVEGRRETARILDVRPVLLEINARVDRVATELLGRQTEFQKGSDAMRPFSQKCHHLDCQLHLPQRARARPLRGRDRCQGPPFDSSALVMGRSDKPIW